MFPKLESFACTALLGLCALFAAPPPAGAAIVTGSWDPPMVSPPFNGLGWTTTINFSVPDDCLNATGTIVNVQFLNRSFGCSSPTPAITVLRAQIGIYGLSDNLLQYVLDLDEDSLRPNLIEVDNGGEISYLWSLLPSNPVAATIGGNGYLFRLALPGGAPQLQYSTTGIFPSFVNASGAPTETLFRIDDVSDPTQVLAETELHVGNSIFTVPEPQTLALALLSLAAAAGVTRRRRS